MNQKELKELIEFLIKKDIAEFELERGDVKVKIKRAAEPGHTPDHRYFAVQPAGPILATAPVQTTPAPATAEPAAAPASPEENLHSVRSPIVGTFYEAP